jgi:hypothetical protein
VALDQAKIANRMERIRVAIWGRVEEIVDLEMEHRKLAKKLNRSLSAQARGVRPPSPREREAREQDKGEARARREARAARRLGSR